MTNPYEVLDQSQKPSNEQATQTSETVPETVQKTNTPTEQKPGKIFDAIAIFFAKIMWHPNPITWEKFTEEEKIISEKTEKKLEDIMGNVGNLLEKAWDKTIEKVNETAKNINEKIINAEKAKNNQITLDNIQEKTINQETQIETKPTIKETIKENEPKITPTKIEQTNTEGNPWIKEQKQPTSTEATNWNIPTEQPATTQTKITPEKNTQTNIGKQSWTETQEQQKNTETTNWNIPTEQATTTQKINN